MGIRAPPFDAKIFTLNRSNDTRLEAWNVAAYLLSDVGDTRIGNIPVPPMHACGQEK